MQPEVLYHFMISVRKLQKKLQEVCKYTVSKEIFLKDENLICTPVTKIRDHPACHSSHRVIRE